MMSKTEQLYLERGVDPADINGFEDAIAELEDIVRKIDTERPQLKMQSRLTTNDDMQLPRVGGVAGGNDNENEKIYYGFGVFMGMPLADLKTLKEDFIEQQARTSRPTPASAASDDHTHRIKDDESNYDHRRDVHMASLHSQQQLPNGYNCQRGQGQQREYPGARYAQGPLSGEQGEEDDNSDGSDESGNKSHSLNFILH